MTGLRLNRYELSQYCLLRSQIVELDGQIREVEREIDILNQYNINISPVYTGMPGGNGRRDKIADFIIRLDDDRRNLNAVLKSLSAERNAIKYRLHKIRAAVSNIPNIQLRDIIIWHYLEGQSIKEIAEKEFLTENAVYKRINRLFRYGSTYKNG